MNTTLIAVDVAKSVFQVAVSHSPGKVHEHHRLTRARFERFFSQHPPTHVLMEACGSAHHWARELQAHGHRVSLLPPAKVSRYRDGTKTDRADAEALLEAERNQKIHRVPVKSVDQQSVTALQRMRSQYLATRTARINALRGLLREFGVVIPVGARHVVSRVRVALDEDVVPPYLRFFFEDAFDEIAQLQDRADAVQARARATRRSHARGPAPHDHPRRRRPHRHRARGLRRRCSSLPIRASLCGLPWSHPQGVLQRLHPPPRIYHQARQHLPAHDAYPRRSLLWSARRCGEPDDLRVWALWVQARRGHNVAAVALANRLARVAWRVWRDQRPFERRLAA